MESEQRIRIENVNLENLKELISLCIPDGKENDTLFIEGAKVKKKWATHMLKTYGSFAKLAYLGPTLVGMIQYMPNPDEKIVEIQCIFVPDKQNNRKGIGSTLLKTLIEEMKTPKLYFNSTPHALVAHAFEVSGWYPQHKFYQKMGFYQVENDCYLLYYPLQEGYVYEKKEFIPQKEDEGKALIFYDPSCPFCVSFNAKTTEAIREITDIPITLINTFEDSKEVKKRGTVPFCVVNKKPIKSFVFDENFQSEVEEALKG